MITENNHKHSCQVDSNAISDKTTTAAKAHNTVDVSL